MDNSEHLQTNTEKKALQTPQAKKPGGSAALVTLFLDAYQRRVEAKVRTEAAHDYNGVIFNLESEVKGVNEALKEKTHFIKQLNNERIVLENTLQSESALKEKAELRVSLLATEKNELETLVNDSRENEAILRTAFGQLEETNRALQSNCDSNRKVIAALRDEMERTQSLIKRNGLKEAKEREKNTLLEKDFNIVEGKVVALRSELEHVRIQLSELETLNETFLNEAAQDERTITALRAEIKDTACKLSDERESYKVHIDKLQDELELKNRMYENLQFKINATEKDNNELKSRITELTSVFKLLGNEFAQLGEVIEGEIKIRENLGEKLKVLADNSKTSNDVIRRLENQISVLMSKIDELKNEKEHLLAQLEDKKLKISNIRESLSPETNQEDLKKFRSQCDSLRNDLNSLREIYETVTTEKAVRENEIEDLKRMMQDVKAENEVLVKERNDSFKTCELLRTEVDSLQENISVVEASREVIEKERAAAISMAEHYESLVNKNEAEIERYLGNSHDHALLEKQVQLLTEEKNYARTLLCKMQNDEGSLRIKYDNIRKEYAILKQSRQEEALAIKEMLERRKSEREKYSKEISLLHKRVWELEIALKKRL